MSSTIVPATLKSTLTASVLLNGQTIVFSNTFATPTIGEASHRIMTVPSASEISIVAFSTTEGAGTYINADVRFIAIANKDTTNFIRLRIVKSGAQTFDIKVPAGGFYVLYNTQESVSATAGTFSSFVDATSINAQADTSAVDCEIFVATI